MTIPPRLLPLFPSTTPDTPRRAGGEETWPGDATRLAAALGRALRGSVDFGPGARALYATDASNYRHVPIGVVVPRDEADLLAALEVCREQRAPVLFRGAATSLAGQTCNAAVVLDLTRHLNQVLEIDPAARTARVQPGLVLDRLNDALRPHELIFGPDPATHTHCTLGGMIGNDSCGVHAMWGGRTSANVERLEVVTQDGLRLDLGPTSSDELARRGNQDGRAGELFRGVAALRERYADEIRRRYPQIPRRVSGYGLDFLLPEQGCHLARALVGSEGTLALTLSATLRVLPRPRWRSLCVVGYQDVFEAADAVPEVVEAGPIGLEGLDRYLVEDDQFKGRNLDAIGQLPRGDGWLMVEFGGESEAEVLARAEALRARLARARRDEMLVLTDPERQRLFWELRESALGATAHDPHPGVGRTWPGWEDSAVHPERLGAYLRELRALLDEHGLTGALYGHFGDGCVHTRIDFDLLRASGIARMRRFVEQAAHLVVRHGGSLSGEHGDGQSRGELLEVMYGPRLVTAFEEWKRLWDPSGLLNPGRVVMARRLDQDLRLGTDYEPHTPATWFAYPEDEHSFARAANRCVGVGKCLRDGGGTMCPSYMVTREERHSTRGRARLLFEMLDGSVLKDGFGSHEVREALDLCLACKGCKGDCPVHVDMATYKAEFLAHHHRWRPRPRAAHSMGRIMVWARLAALAPGLVNWTARAPLLGRLLRFAGGVANQRALPRFARKSFQRRVRAGELERWRGTGRRGPLLLWADTFSNAFEPEIAEAAFQLLEAAGWRVQVSPPGLCCGRPLYDFGLLGPARRSLLRVLSRLRREIRAGVPMVGLEPSCTAVFRDELPHLLPRHQDAQRLTRQVYTLGELLEEQGAEGFLPDPPASWAPAVFQGHCHAKAIMGIEPERRLLGRAGLELSEPEPGCCGMAGAFGFERSHVDVSLAIAEQRLYPALREAATDTLVIADGFSCRRQVEHLGRPRPLHLAEVLVQRLPGAIVPTQVRGVLR